MKEKDDAWGDEEEPADNIDANLFIISSFKEIDTDGGNTTSQIEQGR